CQYEPLPVQLDATRQPRAVRLSTNKEKEVADRPPGFLTRSEAPTNRLERALASFKAADLSPRDHLHIGKAIDALDEIARHTPSQVWPAHDEPHLGGLAREVDRCLTGGVAGAHQRHFLAAAELALKWRGPIVHTRHLELVEVATSSRRYRAPVAITTERAR